MSPVRRLAVVDPIGNAGGGTRFTRRLLPALKSRRPDLQISFYGTVESMRRDELAPHLSRAGISVFALAWDPARDWHSLPFRPRLRRKVGSWLHLAVPSPGAFREREFRAELAAIGEAHDVVYYPWPYRFDMPEASPNIVCTVHDLNYRYWFGAPIFGAAGRAQLDKAMRAWLSRTTVTSSAFMASEIDKFYPGVRPPSVVRLAPFADDVLGIGKPPSDSLRATFGEAVPQYVLSVNNVTYHKNLGAIIGGFARLVERHPGLKLVMVGAGTDEATGTASEIGIVHGTESPNVLGLGYVSNEFVDELISRATVVVNASLYEAGNGSGLDAWSRATPVAMSNIPAFVEHLDALGVEAAVFDARDAGDIAEKLDDVVTNRQRWLQAASRSRVSISKRTWLDVADGYLEAFDRALSDA